MKEARILFFGSYPFSVEYLDSLFEFSSIKIVGIVTIPERVGFNNPVIQWANKYSPRTLKITSSLNAPDFVEYLNSLNFDFVVSAAYPKRIPMKIIEMASKGSLNIHPSLLPAMRGPDPIRRGILNGDEVFGVTFHQLASNFDTGDIYWQRELRVTNSWDTKRIMDELIEVSKNELASVIEEIAVGKLLPKKQFGGASYAEKMTDDECTIDPQMDLQTLIRRVRAARPFKEISVVTSSGNHSIPSSEIYINLSEIVLGSTGLKIKIET